MKIARPLRFLLVGGVNTLVGYSIIFGAKALAGLGDIVANMLGYGVGLLLSFGLNRRWTFRDRGAALPALLRFLLAFAIAYALNLATVLVLIHYGGVNSYLAQFLGLFPYNVAFYLLSRSAVFRSQEPVPSAMVERGQGNP